MFIAVKRIGLYLLAVIVFSVLSYSEQRFIRIFFPDGGSILAELAVNDQQRMRGLMFREGIDEDQGMLFVFVEEKNHSFWMKNMKFAIDILWLDKEKRIIHIEQRVPPCRKEPCPSYAPDLPALYVLELKAGLAEKKGLRLFERIDFILEKRDFLSLIGFQNR